MHMVLDKVSTAIEKGQEISSDLSKLLSLLEQRLTNAEKEGNNNTGLIETRRKEIELELRDLNDKIDKTVENLTGKIDSTKESILKELSKLQEVFDEAQKESEKELNKIQFWRYTIVGGATVVIFLLSQATNFPDVIEWLSKFFSH